MLVQRDLILGIEIKFMRGVMITALLANRIILFLTSVVVEQILGLRTEQMECIIIAQTDMVTG